ncbi:hypothetical protein Taro_040813 [Colocasia esculenta]|uniref:SBP-type domain-containing protein n=1 Tax=Colocasia esculenta TaxID=4460 RepID=A0A843WJS3_COLES|nr:hypothetical protein [Colocasia esculenta]
MEMGSGSLGASGSSDALHGLRFGKKVYFEDAGGGGGGGSRAPAPASVPPMPGLGATSPSASSASSGSAPSSAVAPRRGKGAAQGAQQQPPRCQVEGCRVDLTGAKAYYCRHKVCGVHSKSPKVIVAGLEQRFCQQCSRTADLPPPCIVTHMANLGTEAAECPTRQPWFHQLSEFDQGKRSCRRRLAGHNERRRKPPPGSLSSRYGRVPSTLHEDSNRVGGFVLDFSHSRMSSNARDEWPALRIGDRGTTNHWQAGLDAQSSRVVTNMAHPYMQGSAGGTLFQNHVPPGERFGVSDSSCALSLLSSQPWGAAPTARNRAPTIPDNFEGAPMTQAGAAASFTSNAWGFKGQSSSTAHEYPHEMSSGQAAETVDGQFSGELELALQGSKQCMDPGNGRVYGASGNMRHWSL